jgi:MarR family transcriptional regulator, organic hydroperoxide resistance regulator
MTMSARAEGVRASTIELERFVPYLLFRISRRLNAHLREEMRHEGVTIHRWRVLAVLTAKGSASLSELAAYTVMEQSVISRVVEQMVRDGLVRRSASERDRRVNEVRLTPRGRALFGRVFPVATLHHQRAIDSLSEAEQRTLVRLLQKILVGIGEKEYR